MSIEALADTWENEECLEGINAFFNKKSQIGLWRNNV